MTTETQTQKTWMFVPKRAKIAFSQVQQETEKRVQDLLGRGEESVQILRDKLAPAVRISEDIWNRAWSNTEWIQEKIEDGVRRALESLPIASHRDLAEVRSTVEKLGKKVSRLEGRVRRLSRNQKGARS